MIEDFAVLTPPLIALVRCGLSGSPEAAETLGEIAEPLWPGLLDLAAHHGLLPLLYAGSSAANLTPPVSTAQELQLYAHLAEAHSVMAFRQLEKLLVRCNAAGIKPIVMKGALLAHHYYRTPGLRSFDDLDIVAPLDRRDQLAKLLTDTGYVAEENFFGLDHAWWTEQHYHWFFKSSQGLPVELHWGLTKPGTVIQFDMEALWARSQPVSYHEAQAREFAAEDSLLYLAVHSSKHCFRIPLRNHVDLAILLSKSETLDWEAVLQRSRALGAEMDLAVYLGMGAELGFIVLEREVSRWVRTTTAGNIDFPSLARFALKWPFVIHSHTLIKVIGSSSRERRTQLQSLIKDLARKKAANSTQPPSHITPISDKPAVAADTRVIVFSGISFRLLLKHSLRLLMQILSQMREWRHLRSEIIINRLFENRELPDEDKR